MNGFADMKAVERDADRVWETDAAIRAEFGDKSTYVAYRKGEARGMVRVCGAASPSPSRGVPSAGESDAQRAWDADGDLRAEFGGDFASYQAYTRAETRGQVRVAARAVSVADGLRSTSAPAVQTGATETLAQRQAKVRQENVGRQFAGLPPLEVPQR